MNEEEKYERIEQYLRGELSGQALRDFEQRLDSDELLREELNLHKELEESIKDESIHDFRKILANVDADWQLNEKVGRNTSVILVKIRRWTAVAASILLLAVAYQFFFSQGSSSIENLYARNFETYPMILNQRSLGEESSNLHMLDEAISAYEYKDFVLATQKFEDLSKLYPELIVYEFYLGLSALEGENTNYAITVFNEIVTHGENVFVEQSRWYLALAYLKSDDLKNAKVQLSQISESQYKFQEAQSLLAKLK